MKRRKRGQIRVVLRRIRGGSGERDVKNSGELQRAKRLCDWRGSPEAEVGRGLARYRV